MPHMEGRISHRLSAVRADGAQAKTCCHCRARAAAGSPGDPIEIPRITRGAVKWIDGRAPEGPLVQIGFSDNNRSRRFEFGNGSGIEVRLPVVQNLLDPAVVLTPRVARLSLTENGMP